MRRDMDIVRYILATVGDADGPVDMLGRLPEGVSEEAMAYHVGLLRAHGLVDAPDPARDLCGGYMGLTVDGLTWDGEDWLEATEDGRVWRRTKDVVAKAAGSATLGVIKETASLVAMGLIRGELGL